jgi:hypothetical protein
MLVTCYFIELIWPSNSFCSSPILPVRAVFISDNWTLWFFICSSRSFLIEPSWVSIYEDKNYLTSDYCLVISSIKDDLASDNSFYWPSILSLRIASTSFIYFPSSSFNSSFAFTCSDSIDFWIKFSKSASCFWVPSCFSFIVDFISSFCFARF